MSILQDLINGILLSSGFPCLLNRGRICLYNGIVESLKLKTVVDKQGKKSWIMVKSKKRFSRMKNDKRKPT
jgi:hypothetical protein